MQKKILIIDDEEDICRLLKNFFERRNIRVEYAKTLYTGIKLLQEFRPDIVFLDNNLPDGVGLNEIQTIRKVDSRVQIIMISAMNHLREKALDTGVDYFLEKPISFKSVGSFLG
jgi:two-component system OmpR family response regulator